MKTITTFLAMSAIVAGASAQSFTVTIPKDAPVRPAIYMDFKTHQCGPILMTRIDQLKKFGLDLSAIVGTTSDNPRFSNFTGMTGFSLTGSWTLPQTPYIGTLGTAVTMNTGKQLSTGIVATLGVKF